MVPQCKSGENSIIPLYAHIHNADVTTINIGTRYRKMAKNLAVRREYRIFAVGYRLFVLLRLTPHFWGPPA